MATVSTGEIVVILEFLRERPAREFRRQLDLYYQSRPRKFLDIHVEYMPEATAKLYRHILDDCSTRSDKWRAAATIRPLGILVRAWGRISAAVRRGLMAAAGIPTTPDWHTVGRKPSGSCWGTGSGMARQATKYGQGSGTADLLE
jgi:hypothetical protein